MIQEQYVSFETARLLKEKGFIWQTEKYVGKELPQLATFVQANNSAIDYYACPSISIAMRWLREVHKLYIEIRRDFNTFLFKYYIYDDTRLEVFCDATINSYEDAAEQAIKYCLERMI